MVSGLCLLVGCKHKSHREVLNIAFRLFCWGRFANGLGGLDNSGSATCSYQMTKAFPHSELAHNRKRLNYELAVCSFSVESYLWKRFAHLAGFTNGFIVIGLRRCHSVS